MLNKFILLLCLALPLTVCSQVKLTGKITEENNTAIPYATIQLLSIDSVAVKSEMSKEDGSFLLLANPANYILKISQFGKILYSKNLTLTKETDLGQLKINNENNLQTVVIAGNKPIIKQEFNKLIFSVENSPLKNGYNGLEVLARTPKLQVNSSGQVLLRNNPVMIMINGRKQNLSGQELENYLASLNAEMIKSIEIETSGTANTDAASQGGVINIILKKSPQAFSATLTSAYTYRKNNYWSAQSGLNINYGGDKWNFYAKGDLRKDNDYSTFNTKKYFFSNGGINDAGGTLTGARNNKNLLGGLVFYPNEKQEFGIEGYYGFAKGEHNTPEKLTVYNPQLLSVSDNFRNENYSNNTWYTTLNYTFKKDTLGSTIKLIGDVGRNKSNGVNTTDTRYTFGDFENNKIQYLIEPASNYYTLQGDWIQKYSKKWEWSSGLKYSSVQRDNILQTNSWKGQNEEIRDYALEEFTNTERITAGYFSAAAKLDENNQIKAGLRVEHTGFDGYNKNSDTKVNQSYTGFFPSFYYGYNMGKDRTLSFTYSRSLARPSFTDLNPFIKKENDYSYIMGNPDLKPQYTNKFELTYEMKKQSVSLYANLTHDFIAGVFTDEDNVTFYKPMNFGKEKQFGIDYNFYGDLTSWLYTNISLGSYYYQFKMDQLNPSKLSVNSNIYTRFKLAKTWSLDLTNNFNSRFQSYVVNVDPQYRMDLVLQKTIWSGKGTLKLFCNDIWNTQRDKNASTYNDFALSFYQKRQTQSYRLMFIYNFSTLNKINARTVKSENETRSRL